MSLKYKNNSCLYNRSMHRLCCGITGPKGNQGSNGSNGSTGPTGPTGPSNQTPDVSFSVDKNGTQIIPADVNAFNFTTITGWASLGFGQYNTGSLNEVSGIFTAPIQGKYHFIGSVHCTDLPSPGSVISFRLVNTNFGFQLAETRINASSAFDPNSGMCLNLSHELRLNVGDTVALQLSYLTLVPASGMSVSPNLGITRFVGYLLREVPGDAV